jgi:chromosome partitioning protein
VPVVALISNKGGAGKTTLAMNLAAGLRHRGEDAVVIDADPQGSSSQWARVAMANDEEAVDVVPAGADLAVDLRRLVDRFAHVLIDCPPSIAAKESRAALTLSDLALVPVLPSPLDLWATTRIADAVARAGRDNPELEARLVVNQLEPRTTLSRVLAGVLDELELTVLDASVRRRAVYRNCMLEGRTVYGAGARGRDAVAEMEQVLTEVF